VEKACPGSVVEFDKEMVQYKVRGKTLEKECFRRVFCVIQGLLEGIFEWL
jgi:hypothetical protein